MPAPLGNKNSTLEKRIFSNAVRRMAVQKGGEALQEVVVSLFTEAKTGDVQAIKEIADRLEGKVPQAVTGADGGPIEILEVPWVAGRSR